MFCFPHKMQTGSGAESPTIQSERGALCQGGKEAKFDNLPPFSAEDKNEWSRNSTVLQAFMACVN